MAHSSENLRNLALFGHASTGKTAFVDAMAFLTKVSTRHGNSADGTSVSDSEPEEKERRHTLTSHLFSFQFDQTTLNVIDTPGHPDFQSDVIASLNVVEAGLLFVSATAGITFHARRLWAEAGKAGVGRAVVVTHPDGENASFDEALDSLLTALGDSVVPVTYPDADGKAFTCIHDVMHGDGPRAAEFKEKLADRIAEADDAILERYLETGVLSDAEFEQYLPLAIARGKITPLFTVCPTKELGLKKIASFVQHYFPSPIGYGGRPIAGPDGAPSGTMLEPDPKGPFVGRVFKTVVDPYVGRQSFVRCLSGTLRVANGLFHVRTEKHEKLHGLHTIAGNKPVDADAIVPGDLFVIGKLESLEIGDTVTDDASPMKLPTLQFPAPTYSLAVSPAARGDEQKINQALGKLAAEDPTFRLRRDANTGEMIVSGMSPMHLEIQLARLDRRYGVKTHQKPPSIPYRETVTGKAEGHHRHKKQSGGKGQFGEVYLRVAARDRGEGFEFVDGVVGGSIPRQFIPEVEKGIRSVLKKGILAGCQIVDVQAEVYDGKFHAVDSDQLSFQLAGERAFVDAFSKARPILLEPIMEVEIHVPERFTGDVTSNLATLRGRMSGMEMQNGIQVINAQVPLKEMLEYSTQLRSITAGEGSFSMRESHFEPVPPNIQQEIVNAHKKAAEHA